jgi:hypothetical protein
VVEPEIPFALQINQLQLMRFIWRRADIAICQWQYIHCTDTMRMILHISLLPFYCSYILFSEHHLIQCIVQSSRLSSQSIKSNTILQLRVHYTSFKRRIFEIQSHVYMKGINAINKIIKKLSVFITSAGFHYSFCCLLVSFLIPL